MIKKHFKGTGRLTMLFLYQYRIKLILWIVAIVGVSLAAAMAYPELYATESDITGFAMMMENPAMSALIGSNYAVEDYNIGAVFASEMLLFTVIAVSVMNILLMKSISRGDEEEGRVELVRALPVGNLAYLTAGLIMVFLVNLVLVVSLTSGLALFGADVFTWQNSLLYSSILGSSGWLFAIITALNAQLATTTYGTSILSFAFLIIFYLIRVIGDLYNETISLFSPLGWSLNTEVFVNDDWLPVIFISGMAVVLLCIALYLFSSRDMFDGLIPTRPGKPSASILLKNTIGLIWTFEKVKIISWFLFIFIMCAVFGAVLGELETYFADMDLVQAVLGDSAGEGITEQFITLLIQIMTIFSIIPGVMILNNLKNEELRGRIEHFYTRTVSRSKLFVVFLVLALVSVALMQLSIALGLYSTSVMVLENTLSLETLLKAVYIYMPVVILVLGLATFLIGVFPRLTVLNWLYISFMFVVLYLGSILEFPEWTMNVSALHQIAAYPFETIDWQPIILFSAIGAVFMIIGVVGYNKRDIKSK